MSLAHELGAATARGMTLMGASAAATAWRHMPDMTGYFLAVIGFSLAGGAIWFAGCLLRHGWRQWRTARTASSQAGF